MPSVPEAPVPSLLGKAPALAPSRKHLKKHPGEEGVA